MCQHVLFFIIRFVCVLDIHGHTILLVLYVNVYIPRIHI